LTTKRGAEPGDATGETRPPRVVGWPAKSKEEAMDLRRSSLIVAFGAGALAGLAAAPVARTAAPAPIDSVAFSWDEIEARAAREGRYRQVIKDPTATLDQLEIHVTTLPAGVESHPPHKHPNEEVIIVREGDVEVLVNGQKRRVGPGAVIFQASNQLHSLRNVGEKPATYHVINWHTPGMLKAQQTDNRTNR
jgi:quercetin dioxygenase-like cupin family protein